MATRTIRETTEEIGDKTPAPEESLDDDVLRALVEIDGSGDVTWQIHKVSGMEGERGFCGTMSSVDLTLQNIAEKYGAGKYQVKGIKAGGGYFKSARIEISRASVVAKTDATKDLLASLTGNKSEDSMKFLTLMMQMQQASSQQMTQLLTAMITRPTPEKAFPTEALIASLPALLTAGKEFFATKTDPIKQMADIITITDKLRGKGDDEKGSTWVDLVRDGVNNIPTVIASMRSGNPPAAPTHTEVIATPVAQIAATPEAVAPEGEDVNLKALIELKGKLSMLVERAKKNRDPKTYAEVFVDELPEGIDEEMMIQMLAADDWFIRLKGLDARVEPYEAWFAQLREEVLYIFGVDNEQSDERSSEGGTREIASRAALLNSVAESPVEG